MGIRHPAYEKSRIGITDFINLMAGCGSSCMHGSSFADDYVGMIGPTVCIG